LNMIGKTISHYKILEKLGEGGMGVVYRAEDTKLKRTVALKFLTSQTLGSEEERARFVNEAQAAAALDHPNICTIYEINEVDDRTFISMAYVEGQSLKEKIESGPLELDEALDIAMQVARGLQDAHERGIVHRDIKSANIMVTAKGQAKIMDFGLAKFAGRVGITKVGTTMGTVAYMSPEQARGEAVDHRTDIWSLGVVLYEMLSGQSPFKGEYEQAVIYSILNEDPESIIEYDSNLPLELEKIVKRCLTKDSKERYQAAADLQADLKRAEQDISSGKAPIRIKTTAVLHPIPKLLRKPIVLFGGVILALLLLWVLPFGRKAVKKWLGAEAKNLAVLPFTIVGGDSTDQAFCDGLVESLTSKLAQLEQFERSLWVVPGFEVRKSEITSVNDARRAFSTVTQVITGSIKHMGDMIVLQMNLVDTKTLRQQNSLEIRDHIANIFTWQDGVIMRLVPLLDIELKPEMRRALTAGGTTVPLAYESYLQGLGYLQSDEKAENLDVAISLFKQAIEIDSLYALAYLALGQAYQLKFEKTKNPNFSEFVFSVCNRAIQINDQLFPAYILLGKAYQAMGKYENAIQEYQHVLQIDPENYYATRYLAITLEESGMIIEAESTYKLAIKLRKSFWGGYNDLGVFYYYNGRNSDAEKMFRQTIELMPDHVFALTNLIGVYFLLEKSDLAREMFDRAIAIKPDAVMYSNMATVEFYEGLYANAVTLYEEAIKLGEENSTIFGNLADSYRYATGDSEKAQQAYRDAIRLGEKELAIYPGDVRLRSRLAGYYVEVSDYKNAIAEITNAKSMAPNNSYVLQKCVLVFELAEQRENALQALSEYIKLDGSIEEIEKDPDLSGLRVDPRYRQLVNR